MFSGAAKPGCTTGAFLEFVYDIEIGLHYRDDDELGDPLHGVQHENLAASIPAGNKQLALIVGINQPDQIAEHNAVLVS